MRRQLSLAANRLIIVALFWLTGASAWAQRINAITFDKLPQNYQLYPRDDQNKAQIPISGRVSETGWQYVSVQVFRNRQPISYKRAPISYSADVGRFTVDPITIIAEKAEYDINLYLVKGADSAQVVSRTNIVAGDVYVLTGQSNASAFFRETRTNEFCRTFGKTSGTYGVDPYNPADTAWSVSNETLLTQNVGTFGFEFQQRILDTYGVPTCLINGAFHWSMMQHHATRTPNNPADLTNGYGRMLYRLQKGGLDRSVKALIYRQGESEAYGEGRNWGEYFDIYYKNLQLDLPSIRKLYVFQIDIIDYAVAAAPLVRETQRTLVDKYSNVQVLPSIGTAGFDGLHYSEEGYAQNALELARLVGRDFYNSTDVDNIDAPNIRRTYYSAKDRNEITLLFNDGQEMIWTGQFEGLELNDFFYVDGRAGEVTAGRAAGNRVILTLKNPSGATKLTYLPPDNSRFLYRGPYIVNKRGMRALSFYELPIGDVIVEPGPKPLPAPTLTVAPLSESALQLSWNAISDATGYVLEVKDPQSGTFKSLKQVPGSTLTYRVDGLADNRTYTFRIKAQGTGIESAWYQLDGKTPAFLAAPVVQAGATFATSVVVSWQAVPDAVGYVVERRLATETEYVPVASLSPGVLSYTDNSVKDNSTYSYRVKATGRYSDSPAVTVSVQTPAFLTAPEISVTIVYNNAVTVSWKAVPNATSYQVDRKLPNEEYKRINTFGSAVTSIKDTNLLTGTAYTYRIKAVGDRTESPFASAGATTPSLLEIPAIEVTVVYNNALKVDWKGVPDATGYQVERRSPDQAYQKVGAGTFDPSVLTFSDTSLSPGIAYTYRIKAIGNKTESPTASASAVTPSMLSTPDLVVTPTSFDALALSWKATPNVAYYSLERKMPGAGTYQVIVKKIEPAQTRYVDTLLLHSTEYHYRLVAFGDKTQSAGALANGTTLVLLATSQEPVVTMNIWPNPAIGGQTSLRFSGPVSGTVRIVDLRGVVYAQHTLVNATQMPLALTNYQAGVYLVQVEAEKNVLVQRLLIH